MPVRPKNRRGTIPVGNFIFRIFGKILSYVEYYSENKDIEFDLPEFAAVWEKTKQEFDKLPENVAYLKELPIKLHIFTNWR